MIKKEFLRFTLYATVIYLTGGLLASAVASPAPLWGDGTHSHGHRDLKVPDNRNYARTSAANLNRGEPRTMRLIYFLPNDRPYQAEVVQQMKDEIVRIQTFFAEQMEAHGYGRATFRVETDTQGEPMVHRVDGKHPDSHYLNDTTGTVLDEIDLAFNLEANVYLIVIDNSTDVIGTGNDWTLGVGNRRGKKGGFVLVPGGFGFEIAAHELGHAFGLGHDFRDGAYIMSYGLDSYGPGPQARLSSCHAEYLSVHPYFNLTSSIEEAPPPTIELISPRTYPAAAKHISIQLKVSDSDGLHQVILHAIQSDSPDGASVKTCLGLEDKKNAVIKFDYDGVIPHVHKPSYSISTSLLNPLIHPIRIEAIDTDGNVRWTDFVLVSKALEPLSKTTGDNQHGLPNTPLPVPFVVKLRDVDSGSPIPGVSVTFTVTAGGGRLSVEHTETDRGGRAASVLTLGANLGTNTVEVSAAGIEGAVTFTAVAGAPMDIPDPNLRATVENALNKRAGEPIAPAEMATLSGLIVDNADISNLTGLEHAINLEWLSLVKNAITDISALAGLTNLTWLGMLGSGITDISAVSRLTNLTDLQLHTSITDISALAGLTNLTRLDLSGKSITDISALAGLTNLTQLVLFSTSITDISAVSRLTNLTDLRLSNSAITDISAVSGLTNLEWLWLSGDNISDLSPLVENTGLGSGDMVNVQGNPLNSTSIHTHIPTLQRRGVTVEFDNRTATILLNISGVITASNNTLTVEVRDQRGRTFEGVPVTFRVTSGGGTLSVTNTTTDEKGRAESVLTLGRESNRVRVSAVGVEQTVTFSDVADGVRISDPNLRAAIESKLGKASGAPISLDEMATLTVLRAASRTIVVLTGLEFATNLTWLDLSSNVITDISPLSGLTNLTTLNLGNLYRGTNDITDLSPLSGLTNLTWLNLGDNDITDISPLSGLTNLTWLDLGDNGITDISPLSGLTNLIDLDLWGTDITDISPLSGLTNLTSLNLGDNDITDFSPLSELTNLRDLTLPTVRPDLLPARLRVLSRLPHLTSLGISSRSLLNSIEDVSVLIPALSALTDLTDLSFHGNNISDLSPLAELTNLTSLALAYNNIADISAVAELMNLTSLALAHNNITDISAVAELTNLTTLRLANNNISDLSPLVENTGLGSQGWSWVDIRGNPLSYQSLHTHIPILQNRGVTVYFDDQAHPALLKISGDNQKGASFAPLAQPFVVEAQDANGSALTGISVTFAVTAGGGTISTTTTRTDPNGRAQSTLTLGPSLGTNSVEVSAVGIAVSATFHAVSNTEAPSIVADVNNDGLVNVLDLVLIASNLGQSGQNDADVNGDRVVNILDLVLAAGMFDGAAAAPSAQRQVPETLTAVEVQGWLTDARSLEVRNPIMKRGIIVLEQLLVSLTPKETELLANYPNPFNPETWIPYRLAEDAFVTLTIYDQTGQVVRTIDVGHRIAAVYESRSKAIYWDGRNEFGEQVASGVFFYHLSAGDYSATRKMLIIK